MEFIGNMLKVYFGIYKIHNHSKEIKTFIQQGCIGVIKSDSKCIYIL